MVGLPGRRSRDRVVDIVVRPVSRSPNTWQKSATMRRWSANEGERDNFVLMPARVWPVTPAGASAAAASISEAFTLLIVATPACRVRIYSTPPKK